VTGSLSRCGAFRKWCAFCGALHHASAAEIAPAAVDTGMRVYPRCELGLWRIAGVWDVVGRVAVSAL